MVQPKAARASGVDTGSAPCRDGCVSYDLSVWCVDPFTDAAGLPDRHRWSLHGDQWSREGKGWLLNAGPSVAVTAEDIPEQVEPLLPGIQHVVYLTLEPSGAPEAAFKALRTAASDIARTSRGVVLDPQLDSVELARGVKRYVPVKGAKEARLAVLDMTWWFESESLQDRASLEAFLAALRTDLPEAMPRRYGPTEPPQYELAQTGDEHLLTFLLGHLATGVVWYATAPVAQVSINIKSPTGWQQLGGTMEYRCNRASFRLDAAALLQPGWQTALIRVWKSVSRILRPFYGDVRTLTGYTRTASGLRSDGASDPPPTKSWWWKGVPQRLGHAAVIGEPYLELWPDFLRHARVEHCLAFASTADWRTDEDVTQVVGEVPARIAMEFMPYQASRPGGGQSIAYPKAYPELFPFRRA